MIADIIIVLLLAVAVYFALRKVIKDRKAGIGSCGERCSDCLSGCNCDMSKVPERFRLKK